jgi:NTE family protein
MWLRKTNTSGSSTKRDDRLPQPSAPEQQAAPARTCASALLSAAQIWATESETSPAAGVPTSGVAEPAASVDAPAPLSTVPSPEIRPAVAEMILAAIGMRPVATETKPVATAAVTAEAKPVAEEPKSTATEVRLSTTSERPRLETIAATPALSPPPRLWPPRKLSLALQGGGTFSAFSWGVLERLLEEPGCDFDTISGSSAGAINAALLACGLADGGREAARELLADFWNQMIDEASFRSVMLLGGFSPASSSVSFGPAQRSGHFDALDLNPLREMLARKINFATVQSAAAPRLLIAATRVRDGSPRMFRNGDITPDVLLASTCPPQLHGAVEIDGEAYWDGGYGANPPIIGVVHESSAVDLLVVQVTPSRDNHVPVTSAAIDHRLDRITANAVLNAELAALEWARSDGLHPPRIHRLAAEDEIEGLAQHSAADLGRSFITTLHQGGRDAADRWLREAPNGTTLAIQERRPAFDPEAASLDAELV